MKTTKKRIDPHQDFEDLAKKLHIEFGGAIVFNQYPLFLTLRRGNAWICAYCKQSDFEDAFGEGPVPLSLFHEKGEVTLHFNCAKELGVLEYVFKALPTLEGEKT